MPTIVVSRVPIDMSEVLATVPLADVIPRRTSCSLHRWRMSKHA